MDPVALLTSILQQMINLSLLRVDNAELSVFRLSNSTVNLGCINADNLSVQFYLDSAGGSVEASGMPSPVQGPTAIAPRQDLAEAAVPPPVAHTLTDPVFSIDRTFVFDTIGDGDSYRTHLNGVQITGVRHGGRISVPILNGATDLDLDLKGAALQARYTLVSPKRCPKGFKVSGPNRRLVNRLNRCALPDLVNGGGRDDFAIFQLGAGRRLPVGPDTLVFSKTIYRDAFAVCRLTQSSETEFTLKSYHLLALRKDHRP